MSQVLSRLREATPITREEFAALEPQLRDALLHAQDDLAGRDFPVIVAIDGDETPRSIVEIWPFVMPTCWASSSWVRLCSLRSLRSFWPR